MAAPQVTGIAATLAGLHPGIAPWQVKDCLLYTSDAADDLLCVDLGGSRIIKKKKVRKKESDKKTTRKKHNNDTYTTTVYTR